MTLDAGQAQLRIGLAWWFRKYAKEQSLEDRGRYESEEQEARAKRVGLWQNSDPIPQVVKIDMLKNQPINVTMGIGDQVEQKFSVAERLPGKVTCGLHPWESGFLLASETPYFATTDKTDVTRLSRAETRLFGDAVPATEVGEEAT